VRAEERERLRNVYWIGGGSCAGKSTLARRLAAQHGLRVYATDDSMAEHARRSSPEACPLLHQFAAMTMDERWVERSPVEMFETFHWFRGEGFGLIHDDVLAMPRDRGVIVEGFRLLPRLVQPLLADSDGAVWLLPSPEFRQATIERRGGAAGGFFAKTSDPGRALRNVLERDRMFTERLREEAGRLGLRTIPIDTAMTEEDSAKLVRRAWGM
jgi:2-phosphoglycerate kinase